VITLLVGFPGSGKSYFAVDKIYNLLSDLNPSEFDVIYSNIGGLNFNVFPNSSIDFLKFDIDDFYLFLKQLHTIYNISKNSDNVDDELIKFSKEKGYYRAFFVFDECHDFFSKEDTVKVFWLTYHRHLFHEILLITQNKTLIHSKYRAVPEIFIEAQPRSKKLFSKQLTFKKFSSFSMRKADFFEKITLTLKNDVFSLYQSGNISNQKSILFKYIKFIFIGFIFVVFIFYYVFNSLINKSNSNQTSFDVNSTPVYFDNPNSSFVDKNITSFFPDVSKKENLRSFNPVPIDKPVNIDNFNIMSKDDNLVFSVTCDNLLGCNFNNKNYSFDDFKTFLSSSNSSYNSKIILDDNVTQIIFYSVTTSLYKINKFLK